MGVFGAGATLRAEQTSVVKEPALDTEASPKYESHALPVLRDPRKRPNRPPARTRAHPRERHSSLTWQAPERPQWARRLIAHAEAIGGAERLISLDGEELLESAKRATGLSDFGDDPWREAYDVLVHALERESNLHLIGRAIVRTELLRTLGNRLRLAVLWKQRPQILEEAVDRPVFIVGSPRSGTSILHELMAQDPASRAPALWEMCHPVEALGGEEIAPVADDVTQFWHDVQPEYETMHANSGYLPNECIYITLHSFLSDHWGGNHCVPSYDKHLLGSDQRIAYRYHKRFLQTLSQRSHTRRWLLKAPSHIFVMRELFDVYPDARIVRTHRDPTRTLASAVNLMGTLKWLRCHTVEMAPAADQLAFGLAYCYRKEIEWREAGSLPDDQFIDVQFADIVRDPVGTVEQVYERLGWPIDAEVRKRVADYAKQKPKGSRGVHQYSLEGVGLDREKERERYRFYLERYGVAPEAE